MTHKLRHHYGGWRPQRPDHRDREFLPTYGAIDVQQTEFVLQVDAIPVLDQLQQGACVGHGTVGIVMFDQLKQGQKIVIPSRAMAYYDARIPEGTTGYDAGAQVRDGVKGVAKYGVCPDSEFPYDDQVCDKAPSKQDYADATKQEALVYEAVKYPHIDQAIASGFPVVYGFTVYESFESDEVAKTGVVPVPEKGEQVLGGHCTWLWGFNSKHKAGGNDKLPPQTKAARNSWNKDWGDNGNFYLPQWYFDNEQASDFWVIRRIGPKS